MKDNVDEDKAPEVHSRSIDPIVVNLDPATGSVPADRPTPRAQFGIHSGFRVRVARTDADLTLALRARTGAYGRHYPDFATGLLEAEAADATPDSMVLIAESASTGMADGTVRIQTNFFAPVEIEDELELPERFRGMPMAQISRLGVRLGAGAVAIRLALHKATFLYCLARQVRWMLVSASPAMARQYVGMDFVDVYEDDRRVRLSSSAGMALRIMAFDVTTAERRWREQGHPLYSYMFEAYTPEIDLLGVPSERSRSMLRADARAPRNDGKPATDGGASAGLGRRAGPIGFPLV